MRRSAAAGLAIAIAIVIGIFAVAVWLPGPRAALPSLVAATESASHSAPAPTPRSAGLPDPVRTPGSVNPAATENNLSDTVCKAGWAATQRPPSAYTSALEFAQIIEYGYADRDRSHYEEDHLVPIELGGAPRDPRNLWPEPRQATLADGTPIGSNEKNDLEDALHRRVCAGDLPLTEAQQLIAGNWIDAWEQMGRP